MSLFRFAIKGRREVRWLLQQEGVLLLCSGRSYGMRMGKVRKEGKIYDVRERGVGENC